MANKYHVISKNKSTIFERLPVIGMVTICHYGDYQSRGGEQERLVVTEPVKVGIKETGWISSRFGCNP
jgi:hypothetical protein